jgi:2-polyprenyl-3-methyl-5-hydroxy-6-metoxy-1,4-benzoquinol methylase
MVVGRTPAENQKYVDYIATAQAELFMVELIPHITRLLSRFRHTSTPAKVLDVGCGSGAGTALLQHLFNPSAYTDMHLIVEGVDISDGYWDHRINAYPYVQFWQSDVMDWHRYRHPEFYDLVLSTHAIEHTENPLVFLAGMRGMSRGVTILSCPFNEPEPRLEGHLSTIGYDFIREARPDELHLYQSPTWPASPCAIMIWRGK